MPSIFASPAPNAGYPRFAPEERRGGAKRKSKTKRRVAGVRSHVPKGRDLSTGDAWL
ncbi:hypothetical protein [Candidatus Aquicultor secundus]|uniref:hypothetical protein n=1 Tax=Candidatus Aquicultor secundus TaxID=1973895 RepID=UPI002580DEF4|nr:hypothetical protein [Candidatus Aquicultor secundus]